MGKGNKGENLDWAGCARVRAVLSRKLAASQWLFASPKILPAFYICLYSQRCSAGFLRAVGTSRPAKSPAVITQRGFRGLYGLQPELAEAP
jgi:hypothetical protein